MAVANFQIIAHHETTFFSKACLCCEWPLLDAGTKNTRSLIRHPPFFWSPGFARCLCTCSLCALSIELI